MAIIIIGNQDLADTIAAAHNCQVVPVKHGSGAPAASVEVIPFHSAGGRADAELEKRASKAIRKAGAGALLPIAPRSDRRTMPAWLGEVYDRAVSASVAKPGAYMRGAVAAAMREGKADDLREARAWLAAIPHGNTDRAIRGAVSGLMQLGAWPQSRQEAQDWAV